MTALGKWLTRAGFASLMVSVGVVILGCAGFFALPDDMSQEEQYALVQKVLGGLALTTVSLFVLGFLANRRAR